MHHPARLLSLLLAMPAMSFLAMAISSSPAPLYATYATHPVPWGIDALTDQRAAAVLMWVGGNLSLATAMLIVAAAWKRHDDAVERRRDARDDDALVGRATDG
jgi:putative copper resistance protein D